MIIPRPIILQPSPVIFAPSVVEGIARRAASEAGRPERCVGVARGHGADGIAQRDGAPQGIGEEIARPARVRPHQILVDAERGKQIGDDRRPVEFLDRVEAVVEKARLGRVDGLARAAALSVVLEARGIPAADGHEPIARIPRVGAGPVADQVAVQIVGQRAAPEAELMVGRVVGGAGQDGRQARAGPGTPEDCSVAVGVIAVGQRAQRCRPQLVG